MCEKSYLNENKKNECKCSDEKCCNSCREECRCCAKVVALTIIISAFMTVAMVRCWGTSFIKNDIAREMIKEKVLVQMVKNEVKRDLMIENMKFNSFKFYTHKSMSNCPTCGKK